MDNQPGQSPANSHKEIFLRQLLSAASDALDRLRFEALTKPELLDGDDRFEIRLAPHPAERVLEVSDNGIGLSRDELSEYGAGLHSCLAVADKVALVTRRAGEETAARSEVTGDGGPTIGAAEKARRGTTVTLHLKPADPEKGIEDYTDKWVLARIVRRHADFLSYPVIVQDGRDGQENSPEE